MLFAFADAELDLSQPLDCGLPAEPFESVDVRRHRREEAADWFDGFLGPELVRIAETHLGDATLVPRDAQVVYTVKCEVEDPPDLGYLQAAWASTDWLCHRGASTVLDAHAHRWHPAGALLAQGPRQELDIRNEVTLVCENEPTGDLGHLTHTRGLAKFGRPDFVLFGVAPDTAQVAGNLLNQLALRAALGRAFAVGETIGAGGQPPVRLQPYEPGTAHPELNLGNDGVVLDVRAWNLA